MRIHTHKWLPQCQHCSCCGVVGRWACACYTGCSENAKGSRASITEKPVCSLQGFVCNPEKSPPLATINVWPLFGRPHSHTRLVICATWLAWCVPPRLSTLQLKPFMKYFTDSKHSPQHSCITAHIDVHVQVHVHWRWQHDSSWVVTYLFHCLQMTLKLVHELHSGSV